MSSSIITQQSTGPATETQSGLVSTEAQTMVGTKTFADGIVLKPNTTPTTNPLSGLQVYAKSDNKLYTLNSSGIEQAVGSGGSIVLITQNAHGFTSADIGRPLYLNSSTYTFARADLEASAEVAGLINRIIDANTFEVCLSGEVTPVGANLIEGGGTLTAGQMYFLSTSTAGKITTTEPSTVGLISKPIGIARTTTALDFYNMRGFAVGGANVYTQIVLGNNTTTTIQNVAAYDSLELQGWMFLNATAKYRFLFKAQVTKNGAATDYLISFQHSGDTPPDGFNITVTTAGLVQVTLPSLSGFSSAIAQFSLNGPAVGASLPLQINSSLITVNAGIQFPATMIPSADPNNLDDYREGTFTPTMPSVTAWSGTPTLTGRYTKIGSLVICNIFVSGTKSTASGSIQIGNLPFTNGPMPVIATTWLDALSLTSNYTMCVFYVSANSNIGSFYKLSTQSTASNDTVIQQSEISNGIECYLTLAYHII